jgi:glycosyltransferase involved in cell wall biosynthesis
VQNIVMIASVHLIKDLWQRPQQLAVKMKERGDRLLYINHRSEYIQLRMDKADITMEHILEVCRFFYEDNMEHGEVDNINRLDFIGTRSGERINVCDIFVQYAINRYYKGKADLIITYMSQFAAMLAEMKKNQPEIQIFYDCVDDFADYHGSKKILIDEGFLTQVADGVIVTSNTLYVRKNKDKPCILVPNGVNYEEFLIPREMPKEYKTLTGPVIGYVGALANWFDIDMLHRMAKRRPDWNFVLIGSVFTDETEKFKECPNIILLGRREYVDVPGYMQHMDVGIIPFRLSELIINTNPIKYYEYLAAGIPTVASYMPELVHKPEAFLYETDDEFEEQIEKALVRGRFKPDLAFLAENSWEHRLDDILNFTKDLAKDKNRKKELENILNVYEQSEKQTSIIKVLRAEIMEELQLIEPAKKLLDELEEEYYAGSLHTRIKIAISIADPERVARLVRQMNGYEKDDFLFWDQKGKEFSTVMALRKSHQLQPAIDMAIELYKKDGSFGEEVGNIFFDSEDYTNAYYCYGKIMLDYKKFQTMEAAVNFSRLLVPRDKISVARDVLKTVEESLKEYPNWEELKEEYDL